MNDARRRQAIMAFLTTSAVVTHLVSRARKLAEEALSEIEERKRAEEVLHRQWFEPGENWRLRYMDA